MVARGPRAAAYAALFVGCLVAVSCSSTAPKGDTAPGAGTGGDDALRVEIAEWDFGSIKRGETATRSVALTNSGETALDVIARSTCDCLAAEPVFQSLEPGESGSLQLSFLGEDIKEKATKTIYIETGGPPAKRTSITVTGRVEPGDGPHLECLPSPMLFEKTGDAYGSAPLRVINRGRADLDVSEILCFGCKASEGVFTLAAGEEVEIEVSLADGWTGNRWLEVVSNDPVQATRKISLVVLE
jgi:hypothetical protein